MFINNILDIYFSDDLGLDDGGELSPDLYDLCYELNKKGVIYNYGSTQLMFTRDELDYVVKIPFNGMYIPDEDDDDFTFTPYNCDNYCEMAITIFEEAEEYGISELFAEVRYEGKSKSDTPIYTQKKVIPYNNTDKLYFTKANSKTIANSIMKDNSNKCFKSNWAAAVVEIYGEDTFNNLLKFIDYAHVNDLHSGNYGYTSDGKPIIFDYAGYEEF